MIPYCYKRNKKSYNTLKHVILCDVFESMLNPFVTNGLSHSYHLDESIFIFRDIGSIFSLSFHFPMKIMNANIIAPDGMPRFAASHLGLFCLHMSQKKDGRLIWVNITYHMPYPQNTNVETFTPRHLKFRTLGDLDTTKKC